MEKNRKYYSKRYIRKIVSDLGNFDVSRYDGVIFAIDSASGRQTSGASYERLRLNAEWFKVDGGWRMSDKAIVNMFSSYFHESRHIEQFHSILTKPVFEDRLTRNMAVVRLLSQAYPGYYRANYYDNMCEIDAEISSITATMGFMKKNFPDIDSEQYLLQTVNGYERWFDGKGLIQGGGRGYVNINQAVLSLTDSYIKAYDKRVSYNPVNIYSTAPNLIKEINRHPEQIRAYEACKTGREQNEMLFSFFKTVSTVSIIRISGFKK